MRNREMFDRLMSNCKEIKGIYAVIQSYFEDRNYEEELVNDRGFKHIVNVEDYQFDFNHFLTWSSVNRLSKAEHEELIKLIKENQ